MSSQGSGRSTDASRKTETVRATHGGSSGDTGNHTLRSLEKQTMADLMFRKLANGGKASSQSDR